MQENHKNAAFSGVMVYNILRHTDRGNDTSVPLQHLINLLHHAQQVEEAAAGEKKEGG